MDHENENSQEIIDPYGWPVRNKILEAGGAALQTWARSQGKLFPKGRIPAGFTEENTGYEGARALTGSFASSLRGPDIVFYPNGQVEVYCPGGKVELSLADAMRLARLFDGERPTQGWEGWHEDRAEC